ncbi:MAG TPA: choice-of-anchor tandem repeat GloVer-containing protein [Candidatus Baltobacteraceae bacterium]|nr:choice-of-anchor tandem repeat GloVer-containing protein [Candidatus Baltobacteraceae bacterium]
MKNFRGLFGIFFISFALTACGGGSGGAGALTPSAGNLSAARTFAAGTARRSGHSGYQQLYAFKGTPDGATPFSNVVAVNGKLYGTTLNGSKNYCSASCGGNYCYLGCGTVFSVTPSGKEHVVYNFQGNFGSAHDGSWPFDSLIAINGTMYGTAASAGAHTEGIVFQVTPSGSEQVLYSFAGGSDGGIPEAALTPKGTTLYGTTLYGGGSGCGGSGCGTVFSVTTSGQEKVLYSFAGGADGKTPYAGVASSGNMLYGTTTFGGSGCGTGGCGTVFKMKRSGKDHQVLYKFAGNADGAYPNGLTEVKGVLYGTTEGGGTYNSGTIFSITPSGTKTTLYSFKDIPDGNLPAANFIYNKGSFYGTTVGGGTAGLGTVFKFTPPATETVLYSFLGGSDGNDAQGPVTLYKGWLYGTTHGGGGTGCSSGGGCGTIFRVKP